MFHVSSDQGGLACQRNASDEGVAYVYWPANGFAMDDHVSKRGGALTDWCSSGSGSTKPTPANRWAMWLPSRRRAGWLTALRRIRCISSSMLQPCRAARCSSSALLTPCRLCRKRSTNPSSTRRLKLRISTYCNQPRGREERPRTNSVLPGSGGGVPGLCSEGQSVGAGPWRA